MERSCIDCGLNGCTRVGGQRPPFCLGEGFDLQSETWLSERLADPEILRVVEAAAASAGRAYDEKLSRLDETIAFAHNIGAKKIGIAACVSLAPEAREAARILRESGFEVVGVICKIGSVTNADLDLHAGRRPEAVLCNSIYQAKLLNDEHTDLNVLIGLCAGHDSLFLKYAEALSTVLVAKDFKNDHKSVCALRP